ncbi:MAG: exo-alpha-sialidase [Candidatus Hydrogenedentes bacterium]|nr:exo-alpha-sialidase [Candidatus Hydrogenedentota bacterium]
MNKWRLVSGSVPFAVLANLIPVFAIAGAGIVPGPAAPVNSNAMTDRITDRRCEIGIDSTGQIVVVWHADPTGPNAPYGTDAEIFVARSTDYGATWTAPVPLNSNALNDTAYDDAPAVAGDGSGNWVSVWQSTDDPGWTAGRYNDIFLSRSSDGGATWKKMAKLNSADQPDNRIDSLAKIATDGIGHWVVVWNSMPEVLHVRSYREILVSRSSNNGRTWSAPALIHEAIAADLADETFPRIVTDGRGTWLTIWQSEVTDGADDDDVDIRVSRSTDNGVTWSTPIPINTNHALEDNDNTYPWLTTDRRGNWLAAWMTLDEFDGVPRSRPDIYVAQSFDNGQTWSDPIDVTNDSASRDYIDTYPTLDADGAGNWVVCWTRQRVLSTGLKLDPDIYFSHSRNGGATWTSPALFNSMGTDDSGLDWDPCLATDRNSHWTAVWTSNDVLPGSAGDDDDILHADFTLPQICVERPNGGQQLVIGTKKSIRWNAVGDTGEFVRILLYQNGQKVRRIKNATPNDGQCPWKISPEKFWPGTGFQIRIVPLSASAASDMSDATFNLVMP